MRSPFSALRGARSGVSSLRRVTRFRLFLDCGVAGDRHNFFLLLLRRNPSHAEHYSCQGMSSDLRRGECLINPLLTPDVVSPDIYTCDMLVHPVVVNNTKISDPQIAKVNGQKGGPSRVRTGVAGK